MNFEGGILLTQHDDDPAVVHDGIALERIGQFVRGDGGPIILAGKGRWTERILRWPARVPDDEAGLRLDILPLRAGDGIDAE
jgi:hypothetical protein